ncbi:uncharacterized protein LOC129302761 [Prosopis cineraria]|uniref:uncharacterized protein LOC129302761 n=1 Tax=Prosopis cineraria TaxID=364024 RepID=UPI00240F0F00|nr:uncharacterized protein LOC129302761 [Prosopis cineraria]
MDSDEENRVLFCQEFKPRDHEFDDPVTQDAKENQGFDQESSEEVEKMTVMISEKPFSSYSELREGKSKSKTNGAPGSASGSASSVRVCDFCGRQFSSGKALGGHRRYHIQAQKKMEAQQQREKVNHSSDQCPSSNNYYTLRTKPSNNNMSEDFAGGDDNRIKSNIGNLNNSSTSFRCCVCEKDFPSKKSLFGHMRSHPEREWRGMNPPFTDNAPLASSSSPEAQFKASAQDRYHDNDVGEANLNNNNGSSSSSLEEGGATAIVDLSLSCSGSWLKKDRRGRGSFGAAQAAQTLMYMYSFGNYFRHLPPPDPPATVLLPVKKRKKNVNDVINSSSPLAGKHSLNCTEKLEGISENKLKPENDDDDEIWKMKVMSLVKEKKKIKKNKKNNSSGEGELLIRTLKEEVKPAQSYVCKICDKSFSTFQALGGHRSKHNRGKNIVISLKGKEQGEEEEEEEPHKVCINGANLSAGARLSEEEEEAASLISEERLVSSSNNQENNSNNEEEMEEASHQSGSKILDFDLNVPYVSEHEETDKSTSFYE